MSEELVLFKSADENIVLNVAIDKDTVWLTQAQMVTLFSTSKQNVSLHINNCFREGELEKNSVVKESLTTASDGKNYKTKQYNLDVIISVGYRVKSNRGVEFRRWATGVLKQFILNGVVENKQRLSQLDKTVQVMARIPDSLETRQILDIVQSYMPALDLLDDYDHQRIQQPKGSKATYVLSYEECRAVIDGMKFTSDSDLFGVEKDDSFKGTVGNIYQGFAGQEIYPSLEEKAANLLYLTVKNHSFLDGNKRIAATMFLYFLDKNDALFKSDEKVIDDSTLVAITVMIAESKPEEKAAMIALVMNFLTMKRDSNE